MKPFEPCRNESLTLAASSIPKSQLSTNLILKAYPRLQQLVLDLALVEERALGSLNVAKISLAAMTLPLAPPLILPLNPRPALT